MAKPAQYLVMQIFLCLYKPYKESISTEMNTNNDLNLHLHDQMSGWLRYCQYGNEKGKVNTIIYYMSIEIYVKYSAEIKFVFHCLLYFSHVKFVV